LKDQPLNIEGEMMSTSNEVVTSRLKRAVSFPCLDEIYRLIQIQLVLKDSCRKLRIAKDAYKRVSKVLAEAINGFIVQQKIVIIIEGRVFLPASWILRILTGRDVPFLLVSSETEHHSGRSSSNSRHG
jgi:hypothetical protein